MGCRITQGVEETVAIEPNGLQNICNSSMMSGGRLLPSAEAVEGAAHHLSSEVDHVFPGSVSTSGRSASRLSAGRSPLGVVFHVRHSLPTSEASVVVAN